MIFNKDAIFPYPILSPYSNDYHESIFHIDLELISTKTEYTFLFDIKLTSKFVRDLIKSKKAKYIAVISSVDNKVFEMKDARVTIPKKEAVLNKKTNIQVFVVANTRISMANNNDLNSFYDTTKKDIFLNKYTAIAFSNVVKFDGEIKKPFKLFKYSYDTKSRTELDIKIDKASEFIEIQFRDEQFSFNTFGRIKDQLMYPYVYMGLQKALTQMILDLSEKDLTFNVEDIEEPDDLLYRKLYNYLKIKKVNEVSIENLHQVIEQISDKIVSKFTKVIGGLRDED